MNYLTIEFYILLLITFVLYYLTPKKWQWLVLLIGSTSFYYFACNHWQQIFVFIVSITMSYIWGVLLNRQKFKDSKIWLILAVLSSAGPLLTVKFLDFAKISGINHNTYSILIPLGLSFYSLQMISYLVDCYQNKIIAEKNYLKYMLFISFFPQIIQGPIPRFSDLHKQLISEHVFNYEQIVRGIQLIIWGFFLKFMIADKAGVFVDAVFNNPNDYVGFYVLIAGILYSIQLYTDFYSCTTISQGVAQLFGIHITDNFRHPYFSSSVKEFWRRWHISLSYWLRDYIYIPLGGNRNGRAFKFANLMITFLVSGFWHGSDWRFVFWGVLHGVYQIVGDVLEKSFDKFYNVLGFQKENVWYKFLNVLITFFLVMFAWIIFRAQGLTVAFKMIKNMVCYLNPWILFNNEIFGLGLDIKEWIVLSTSIIVLIIVSLIQEKYCIRDWFNAQPLLVRWIIYIVSICAVWVFGTYGFGFNAKDFIYGGF